MVVSPTPLQRLAMNECVVVHRQNMNNEFGITFKRPQELWTRRHAEQPPSVWAPQPVNAWPEAEGNAR